MAPKPEQEIPKECRYQHVGTRAGYVDYSHAGLSVLKRNVPHYYISFPKPVAGATQSCREWIMEGEVRELCEYLKTWRLLNGMNEDGTPA